MDNIDKVLSERGSNYGDFKDNAELSQKLKLLFRNSPSWNNMEPFQKEALEYFIGKLVRILNGDPDYIDSWVDIAGYSKLVVNILEKKDV